MSSRNKILERIKQNQPVQHAGTSHYDISPHHYSDATAKFKETLVAIGGSVFEIDSVGEIDHYISNSFINVKNPLIFLPGYRELRSNDKGKGHDYEDVDLAVLKGEFAVAENSAIWINEKNMLDRSLPFICENLILIINREDIVQTLHEAYVRIDNSKYEYGTFIAGPSKTADIEQSLVLGAHGPKSLTVLLLRNAR